VEAKEQTSGKAKERANEVDSEEKKVKEM